MSDASTVQPPRPKPSLGRTLPSLLYTATDLYRTPNAFNRPVGDGWETLSGEAFRERTEAVAFGLLALGLVSGERTGLYLESDTDFCLTDFGCLIAGLVDVPIYLSQGTENVRFVLEHAGVRLLFVTNESRLDEIRGALPGLKRLSYIVLAHPQDGSLPEVEGVEVLRLADVEKTGRERAVAASVTAREMAARIDPKALATIIYTSGTTGTPKGVMLSHENLSANALYAFDGLTEFVSGPQGETVLSFLPLSHVFARTLCYGTIANGSPLFFSTPDKLKADFPRVRPTVMATVPRVLEKLYAAINEKTAAASGIKGRIAKWGLRLAGAFELGAEHQPTIKERIADRLVYAKWRDAMGGRMKYVICGGAALSADLANLFGAAGVTILQGYGLTETSPVITFNRPNANRAGMVGTPLEHVEVRIAEDGEILSRGPHIMMGYYEDADRTAEVIDEDGWFHTGDIGEINAEGFLRITDRKKDLFKLSTGKYVMPQPLENRLSGDPLIEQAVVVGSNRKFTAALIFPEPGNVRKAADEFDLNADDPLDRLLEAPEIRAEFQRRIDEANSGMDHWCQIKRFWLVPDSVTVENGLLTPTLKIKRNRVREQFADLIEALYRENPK